MKIGIDARLFGPKWGGGGIGRYVEELISELQTLANDHRFVIFLKKENFEACQINNHRFTKILADVHWYTLKEQLIMPQLIRQAGLDLIHYPHWNVPIRCRTPFVVTIHDLILLDDPNSAKATTRGPLQLAIKRFGHTLVLRHAISKSRQIIVPSVFVRASILQHFPSVNPAKISIIPEGVRTTTVTEEKIKELPVTPPYFLYVGSAYPHKNLESLLHAFSFFVKKHPEIKLVLVGKDDVFYQRLRQELEEIDIVKEAVVFTGFVPDEILANLYAHASLFLFPSCQEGFGLPPLEAMAYGLPVAAARSACLPEVLKNAVLYFNPHDIEEMVAVMEKILNDSQLRTTMIAKGLKRAEEFSWRRQAETTLNTYEQAIQSK